MSINLHLPPSQQRQDGLRPMITVVGVGGAGGNAVNNMIAAKLEGVRFVVANTDAQALENARTENAIQMGTKVTGGLGAGANPEMGRAAAEEALEEIAEHIHGSHMVFIAAGMGGGTGTGAAPVVARLAREQGILTIGVVTKPFQFEGTHRMKLAENGIKELQDYVDTLIIIPNQNLFRVSNERTTFVDAFRMADEVLHSGVRGITDLMVKPGLVNLDFADIRTVMREMGKAMMGTGEASGERRAIEAAEAAISNPLLDDVSLKGAKAVLINITGGMDMTLFEVDEAANRIRDEVDPDANIIFGSAFNESMNGSMRVSVVATGIDSAQAQQPQPRRTNVFATPEKKPFSFDGMRPAPKPAYEPQPQREAAPYPTFQAEARTPVQPVREAAPAPRDSFDFGREEQRVTAYREPAPVHHEPIRQAEAPAPVRPVAEPRLHSEPVMARPEPQPEPARFEGRREAPREEEDSGAFGFLQKMAGVGKVLSRSERPEPERTVQVIERPKVVEKKEASPAAQGNEEEYLDIPAFLRRQAN